MRQQFLTAYVLHARAYQEKRAIYQLFTSEFGVVHGVGMRGVPSFMPIELFATGNNALKTFSQIQPTAAFTLSPVVGRSQYALLYMNEVLCRLLALENACPALWQVYHEEVLNLRSLTCKDETMQAMKCSLRRFERALFDELGVSIDFACDGLGGAIIDDDYYRFVPELGFIQINSTLIHQAKEAGKRVGRVAYLGADLLLMGRACDDERIYVEKLDAFGQLQKEMIDYLLEYKPLHSRKLWQQSLGFLNQQ